jgi:hypothetical protein
MSADRPPSHAATIWVEGPARSEIERLRQRWDSQHAAVAAHMTVVYPQPARVEEASILARAREALRGAQPFTIRLIRWAGLGDLEAIHTTGTAVLLAAFPNFQNPIVLLPDASGLAVLELRRRLNAVFDQPVALLDHPPFVTIGQGLNEREAAEAAAALSTYQPGLSFEVHAVDLLRLDPSGASSSLGRVDLAGGTLQ